MKALVTGGAGFIGSHIVDKLIEENYEVFILDNLSAGSKNYLNKNARFYKVDIRDPKVDQIFREEKPDFVFHEAAQIDVGTSIENPIFDLDVNLVGTLRIFGNCVKTGVKKVIIPSSAAVYGSSEVFPVDEEAKTFPTVPYAFGKLAVEQYAEFYARFYKLNITLLRYANVYGPRQSSPGEGVVVQKFISKYLNKEKPVINGDGNQTRDFIYVSDVVEANIKAINKKLLGPINISTARETSINELAEKIAKITGKKAKPKYAPAKPQEVYRSCLDNKLARKTLRWEPKVKLIEGLSKTISWFRNKS